MPFVALVAFVIGGMPAGASSGCCGDVDLSRERAGGIECKADLVALIRKSDRIVATEHSDSMDFLGLVQRPEKPEPIVYGTKELSAAERAFFLDTIESMDPKTQEWFSACAPAYRHAFRFYSGKTLVSTMDVCFGCGSVRWSETQALPPIALKSSLAKVIEHIGFSPKRDWRSLVSERLGVALPDAEISAVLIRLGAADQAVRKKLTPVLAAGGIQSDEFKEVAREMSVIDANNLAQLEEIIARIGWPDIHRFGIDASNSAFLVLQHGSLPAQKRLLPLFRRAALTGKARGDDLAMLEDRILVGDGRKQLYGTQINAGPDGIPRVSPVEDPENLEARRKAVGLPTMQEYLERAAAELGKEIDTSAIALKLDR